MSDEAKEERQLQREDLTPARVAAYAAMLAKHGMAPPLDEAAREASRRAVLAEIADGEDLWVFGYGSLMWNPALNVADSRVATVPGFRRAFCLTLNLGRGTPEKPGLMLGLDAAEGDACAGIAHRIAGADIDSETQILWYREMISGAYRADWLAAEIDGVGAARVLGFVVRRDHPRYESLLDEDELVRRIAQSEGVLGSNRDYLYRTHEFLAARGLAEDWLSRLAARVRDRHAQQQGSKT